MDTVNPNTFGKIHSFNKSDFPSLSLVQFLWPLSRNSNYSPCRQDTFFSSRCFEHWYTVIWEDWDFGKCRRNFKSSRDKTNKSSYISPCTVVHRTIHVHLSWWVHRRMITWIYYMLNLYNIVKPTTVSSHTRFKHCTRTCSHGQTNAVNICNVFHY